MPNCPRTYGGMFASLQAVLRPIDLLDTLQIHRTFCAHAMGQWGVPKESLSVLRGKLQSHARMYPNMLTSHMDKLLNYLPTKFNVRGTWTPE